MQPLRGFIVQWGLMLRRFSKEQLFVGLASLFVTIVLVSTIASTKIVAIGLFVFDAGTILFPLSYVVASVLTELYESRRAEFVIITGLAMQILTSVTFMIVATLPAEASWHHQEAYLAILGVVPRIAIASLAAYLIGEFLNVKLLTILKKRLPSRRTVRIIVALVSAQFVDTVLFSTLAFAGTMPGETLVTLIGTVLAIKITVIVIFAPLSARLIRALQ